MILNASSKSPRVNFYIPVWILCLLFVSLRGLSQETQKPEVTFLGNIFKLHYPVDTYYMTDPVTGAMAASVAKRSPIPVAINGNKIYDLSEITKNPEFTPGKLSFRDYVFTNIRKELDKLPDGSYQLDLSNIVVDPLGAIVFFDSGGILHSEYRVDKEIETGLKNEIDRKLYQITIGAHGTAGEISGVKVPVRINCIMFMDSFGIKDHKVINWK